MASSKKWTKDWVCGRSGWRLNGTPYKVGKCGYYEHWCVVKGTEITKCFGKKFQKAKAAAAKMAGK